MLFSSTVFLFAFLPAVLGLYFLLPRVAWRNALLLSASLLFYAWGEAGFVGILLVSIALNYAFGLAIDRLRGARSQWWVLCAAVASNLALLGFFKYANFALENLNALRAQLSLSPIELAPVHLPIGISFFTFQALTYVVDVYRRDAPVQHSPARVALYIALFPQLIAGPIVRYHQIADELSQRGARLEEIADGIRRFVIGLAKKVLLANTLALPVDAIFALPASELQPGVAWLGAVCFALQIYFDFAGYSDMAIGLGRVFGFHFPENFDAPYVARSVREFWRRWHISLSTWFRDYLYIPLGGSRRSAARTLANLFAVFLLCGLWHGASWNFVIWGALHGGFLALERGRLGAWLARAPAPLGRLYCLAVVLFAWVFFRCDDLSHAVGYLAAMTGVATPANDHFPLALYVDAKLMLALGAALLVSGEWTRTLPARAAERIPDAGFAALRVTSVCLLLLACAMSLAAGTHNPFIYFRF